MSERRLPVRPNLDQLKIQAKELLRAMRSDDAAAIADFKKFHPRDVTPATAKLADAQLVLARSYEAPSWPRLVTACKLIEAIWGDDVETVRKIVEKDPRLLHEDALTRPSNWGPPMSYAANLGRDRIIEMLHGLGARDLATALNRASLQTQIGTARKLHAMMQSPALGADALVDPAYTLSADGTALVLELGATVVDAQGRRLAPVNVVLESDSRKPAAKHAILEMYAEHGLICWRSICGGIRRCCGGRFGLMRSIRRRWVATTSCRRRMGRRWLGRRCCTWLSTTTRWKSRDGCWIAAWMPTSKLPWMLMDSAATRLCSRLLWRSRISG
jgi:hypothetical protein